LLIQTIDRGVDSFKAIVRAFDSRRVTRRVAAGQN
jgi:hypothetical protein